MFSSVADILTYDGSVTDVVLNYTALIVNTIVLAALCICSSRSRCDDNRNRKQPMSFDLSDHCTWVLVTLFLVCFQIFLCSVIVRCVGISVVWSAQCGFSLLKFLFLPNLFSKKKLSAAVLVSISLSLALWIYYLIASDLITTIAHICSIVLGVALFILLRMLCRPQGELTRQGEEHAVTGEPRSEVQHEYD